MKKFIHVTKDVRDKLQKIFNITPVMVWKALTFESSSALAEKIRKAALENYGILMNELPCAETFHDHDHVMRQYFPNGALIELDRNNGYGYVIFKGKTVKTYKNVMIREIAAIQQFAESLQ